MSAERIPAPNTKKPRPSEEKPGPCSPTSVGMGGEALSGFG